MSIFDGIEEVSTGPPSGTMSGGPVSSLEFRRIIDLPRRRWEEAHDLEDLVGGLTEMLRAHGGTMSLKTVQAAALRDIHDHGGLFGPIVVGGGKTLITLLAPVVMKAERPVLLVPASVRDQTLGKVLPAMRKHWVLHNNLKVVAYSELSQAKNVDLLDRLDPDMILADECHMLKNPKSGRTRRVSRYMNAHPGTTFVAVSGTVANHSIMHFWHVVQWALKPNNAPVPKGWNEAKEWSYALDERVRPEERTGPGCLTQWAPQKVTALPGSLESHPGSPTTQARRGYRQRLVETPGVLATGAEELGVSLRVMGIRGQMLPATVTNIMRQVEDTWETPDGDVIMEAVQLWKIMRELSCGFYYRWSPKPPQEWLKARKAWNKFVRETLSNNRRRLDTPLQVWNSAERALAVGAVAPQQFHQWALWKRRFKPNTEAVWVNAYLVERAAAWLQEPGICWVEHREMGEAISRCAGVPYFGAGDSGILDASGPVVASIKAHGTGKNLQQWDRNLVVSPPTGGGTWEQLLGRTHRMGQESDTVTYEVNVHCRPFREAMTQAFADARFLEDTLGNRQRLLYCDTDLEKS